MELTSGLLLLLFVGIIYFIPAIVAEQRKHRNKGAIGALNFFLGWSIIGWVCALVWALTNNTKEGK